MNWKCLLPLFTLVWVACKVTQPYQRPATYATTALYRDTLDSIVAHNNITDTTSIANMSWKEIFTDTVLQSLIQEGINNNLDLKIAVARIKEAQANFRQSKDALFPTLDVNASATLQKLPSTTTGSTHIYQLYGSSSWTVDLWGRLRSAEKAQLALLLQSYAYQHAVQTQLVASIVTDYYTLLSYDQQLQVTQATVSNRAEDVNVTKALKDADVVTGAAVMQSQANMYSAEVTIPDLKQNIRETENALSILLAREPGLIKRDSLKDQTITSDLRTGLPIKLLANRPDVQEAEYQLRYAFELTNVARAYFYPELSLNGEAGLSATQLKPFNAFAFFGSIMAGLTEPIFNNGLNRQRLNVAKGQQEEAFNNFRKTLLTAGQEVSNALYDYKSATDKIIIRTQQLFYLQKAVDYTTELMKYNNENTNYTDVLTSEQNLLAAQLSSINDKLQQLQAVVNLYSSLGGGWR